MPLEEILSFLSLIVFSSFSYCIFFSLFFLSFLLFSLALILILTASHIAALDMNPVNLHPWCEPDLNMDRFQVVSSSILSSRLFSLTEKTTI